MSAWAVFFTVVFMVIFGSAFITGLAFGIKMLWGAGRIWLDGKKWYREWRP